MARPQHINPMQWTEALGFARVSCARIFRNGGAPADALKAFGLVTPVAANDDWGKVVETIAQSLCSGMRKAA
jgi:hypothetical protein